MASNDNTTPDTTSTQIVKKQGYEKCDELFKALLTPTNPGDSITLSPTNVGNLQKAGTFLVKTLTTTLQTVSNMTEAAVKNAAAAESNAAAAVSHADTIGKMRCDVSQANVRADNVTNDLLAAQTYSHNTGVALVQENARANFLHVQYCKTFYTKYGNPNTNCRPKDKTPCHGCVRRECKSPRDIDEAWQEYLDNTGCTVYITRLNPYTPRR